MAVTGANPVRYIRVRMKDGSTPTISSPLMTVYKGSTDLTSTYTTGSCTAVGDIVKTATFQNLVANDDLFVVVSATLNSVPYRSIGAYWLHVLPLSGMTKYQNGIPWVKEREQYEYAVANTTARRAIRVPTKDGALPVIASETMYVYKNGTDVTSTYTTGSMEVNDDEGVIFTKGFTGLVAGDDLFVTVAANVNGIVDAVGCWWLHILPLSGRT